MDIKLCSLIEFGEWIGEATSQILSVKTKPAMFVILIAFASYPQRCQFSACIAHCVKCHRYNVIKFCVILSISNSLMALQKQYKDMTSHTLLI